MILGTKHQANEIAKSKGLKIAFGRESYIMRKDTSEVISCVFDGEEYDCVVGLPSFVNAKV